MQTQCQTSFWHQKSVACSFSFSKMIFLFGKVQVLNFFSSLAAFSDWFMFKFVSFCIQSFYLSIIQILMTRLKQLRLTFLFACCNYLSEKKESFFSVSLLGCLILMNELSPILVYRYKFIIYIYLQSGRKGNSQGFILVFDMKYFSYVLWNTFVLSFLNLSCLFLIIRNQRICSIENIVDQQSI